MTLKIVRGNGPAATEAVEYTNLPSRVWVLSILHVVEGIFLFFCKGHDFEDRARFRPCSYRFLRWWCTTQQPINPGPLEQQIAFKCDPLITAHL